MAIDLSRERLLTFDEAARDMLRGIRPVYPSWWRWYRHGIRGVKLETLKVSGRRYTTAEAVQRFFAAVTAASNGETAPTRNSLATNRAQARAEVLLDREGL